MTDTTDIPQLDTIDALLDGLTDADLLQIYRTLLPFDEGMLVAAVALRALGGGGGGGGLPTGWTADDPDPGDLDMADGKLATAFPIDFSVTTAAFGTDVTGMGVGPGLVLFNVAGANVVADTDGGVSSAPSGGVAYAADGSNGATIAFDAGGLAVVNLPTEDPGIAGALWNNGGTPAISAG